MMGNHLVDITTEGRDAKTDSNADKVPPIKEDDKQSNPINP